jgi:trehalose-6-phosphate hydrolase
VFYTYQQLITLRKTTPVLTWGDYQDLLPEHPSLWCYRRQWQGQTLVVAANLSREFQSWQPEEVDGDWQIDEQLRGSGEPPGRHDPAAV